MVDCPICGKQVKPANINDHLDSNCSSYIEQNVESTTTSASQPVANFFKTPTARREISIPPSSSPRSTSKRPLDNGHVDASPSIDNHAQSKHDVEPPAKRSKPNALQRAAPLAERMRPKTLDEIAGQELVGPNGVLRGLIEKDSVPSMILWGPSGTGKTTIARVIATVVGSRFVEINATSSGVGELKKIFAEAKSELGLTSRKTIIFCDEIHRFSKSQQDVFLGPVESGQVTLIGATTENPSFKVQNALLSRCRTFTLQPLTEENISAILRKALEAERQNYNPSALVDEGLIKYLAAFADGDARSALNLLELAMELSQRRDMTLEKLKSALTKTLVYDRAGDQHYDTISAFHKSVRGSNADAALYYLARMLQSGEDPRYIARRMVVMASEDVGLADNTLLPLAMAAYDAAEKIGMPEARINLAHAAVALSLAPKSTRSYRGLSNAEAALREPGIASLPIPIHLRNAPTRLMKELGYGKEYKYNPSYVDGKVKQDYLPEKLMGRKFLEDLDLGTEVDPDLKAEERDVNGQTHGPEAEQNSEELHGTPPKQVNEHIKDHSIAAADNTQDTSPISRTFSSTDFAQRSSQPLPSSVSQHESFKQSYSSSAPVSQNLASDCHKLDSAASNHRSSLLSLAQKGFERNGIQEDIVPEDHEPQSPVDADPDPDDDNNTTQDNDEVEFYNEYDSFV